MAKNIYKKPMVTSGTMKKSVLKEASEPKVKSKDLKKKKKKK